MTPAEAFVERTTRASGVPVRIEDSATLARLAVLIGTRNHPPQSIGADHGPASPRPRDRRLGVRAGAASGS